MDRKNAIGQLVRLRERELTSWRPGGWLELAGSRRRRRNWAPDYVIANANFGGGGLGRLGVCNFRVFECVCVCAFVPNCAV